MRNSRFVPVLVKIITSLTLLLNVRYLLTILVLVITGFLFSSAYAHTSVHVGPYEIEVGYDIEPPVVGYRNAIVYEISESPSEDVKKGVTNAFKNLESTIRFGGITKVLDVNSETKPGHYFSNIIPTKTGSFSIVLKGEIEGVEIDEIITIEDVESTAVLDFPPTSGSSSNEDVAALKNAMSFVQKDISDIKSKVDVIDSGSSDDAGPAYDFAVFALSLGAAGVILAIIAMIKRK